MHTHVHIHTHIQTSKFMAKLLPVNSVVIEVSHTHLRHSTHMCSRAATEHIYSRTCTQTQTHTHKHTQTSKGMARSLSVYENSVVVKVRHSFDIVQSRTTMDQLGDVFLEKITRIAPHTLHLFKRPRKVCSYDYILILCANKTLLPSTYHHAS
jgi:hypothetical protein